MTLCAGLFQGTEILSTIRLSEPLLKFRTKKETRETLLHEMIHAYNYICKDDLSDDRSGHGKNFKKKMDEINKKTGFNITIFHKFHDEVDYYRQHVWKCDGICVNKKPYYGIVKRAMNRPPSNKDFWWDNHKKSCGGNFYKINEPKKIEKKKNVKVKVENKKKDKDKNKSEKEKEIKSRVGNNNNIEKYLKFPKKKIENKIELDENDNDFDDFDIDNKEKEKLKRNKKAKK